MCSKAKVTAASSQFLFSKSDDIIGVGRRGRRDDGTHHFAVDGAGDFDATVFEAWHGRRAGPCRVVPDVARFGQEVGQGAGVKLCLLQGTRAQQVLAAAVEVAMQDGQEPHGVVRQDLRMFVRDGTCAS